MSTFKTTTESAATKDGILYVSTTPDGGEPEIAGDPAFTGIVAGTLKLAAITDERKAKLVLAEVCVEVHILPGVTISVVYRQGAPIVKSLQRMVRRMARANASNRGHTSSAAPTYGVGHARILARVKELFADRDSLIPQAGHERRILEIDAELAELVSDKPAATTATSEGPSGDVLTMEPLTMGDLMDSWDDGDDDTREPAQA